MGFINQQTSLGGTIFRPKAIPPAMSEQPRAEPAEPAHGVRAVEESGQVRFVISTCFNDEKLGIQR